MHHLRRNARHGAGHFVREVVEAGDVAQQRGHGAGEELLRVAHVALLVLRAPALREVGARGKRELRDVQRWESCES